MNQHAPVEAPLDYKAFADRIGVTVPTLRSYLRDARANRKAGKFLVGDVPEPDVVVGSSPAWYRSTVEQFIADRPGRQGTKEEEK